MKLFKTLSITVILFCLVETAVATELNGRINILNNDGANYKIMLQLNTDLEPGELGGATIILDYDNTILSYPDEPEMGVDFIFDNFNSGYYDEAKVTKVTDNQIWLNINLISDEYGTIVTNGPYQWTNFVLLNFESNDIITSSVVFWDINNSYWSVYDSDNATTWGIGNFDNTTTLIENENVENPINSYMLYQNYPNPFNPSTKISWQAPEGSWQTLKIYDMLGNEIATLVDEYKPAGVYEISFNMAQISRSEISSGVYFYQLKADDPSTGSGRSFVQTKKMILLK